MKIRRLSAGLLSLLVLAGCGAQRGSFLPQGVEVDAAEAEAELDVQLGLLKEEITDEERQAALDIWLKVKSVRDERIGRGEYDRSNYEWRLLQRLSRLYDDYTIQYLGGDEAGFGYRNPPEKTLAVYEIGSGGVLTPDGDNDFTNSQWSEAELLGLWDQMLELLPQGAFDHFDRLTMFTDGPDETVAWVWNLDDGGTTWEIALDPADSADRVYFVETVLHEYAHYLTLNDQQVTYTREQTLDTYNEYGMVSRKGSYIDDFYQAFWTGYLDDCLACEDTFNFFLRHYDDFIDPYASTDPSEDICESFTFFILRPRDPDADSDVWSQKLDFFYRYPELVEFRTTVRGNLGLTRWDYFEDLYQEEPEGVAA